MGRLSKLLLSDVNSKPCTVAVAAAADLPVLKALQKAVEYQIANPLLFGSEPEIIKICKEIQFDISTFEIVHEPNPQKAAQLAVKSVNDKRAGILMKGLVPTAVLLKALVSKEYDLRLSPLLSHLAIFESPFYGKFLGVSDAAMNISPSLEDKVEIIRNAVSVLHQLGNNSPKVAILAPLEMVNDKIESTVHAAALQQKNKNGEISGCIVEGPLALDNAISKEASKHKGINGIVAGDADLLIVPDLNTGNVLYKSLIFLGGATSAAIIIGAKVPVVLTSRADSEESKLLSIALAARLNSCNPTDAK